MAALLKQSTTVTVRLGPYLDKTDGVTEKTALTPVVEVSKNHGAFAARNSATAITHDSNGWYAVELNATDTNTLGPMVVKSDDATTHLPVWREFEVVGANVFDSLIGGTDKLQVDLAEWIGVAPLALVTQLVQAQANQLATQAKADVNAEVDAALDTAVPATPTADSVNERMKTLDDNYTATRATKIDNLDATVSTRSTFNVATQNVTVGDIVAAALAKFFTTATGQTYATAVAQSVVKEIADNAGGGSETRLRTGTAQAGGSNTITLDAGASAVTNFYKHAILAITAGTGAGQAQIIDSYDGTTKVATMAAAWATAPNNTSQFVILPLGTIPGASAPTAAQVSDQVLNDLATEKRTVNRSTGEIRHYKADQTTVRGTLRITEIDANTQGLLPV
ncbi:MAG: hypothetical protein AABZ12_12930 [Planctomycetota bacterium]